MFSWYKLEAWKPHWTQVLYFLSCTAARCSARALGLSAYFSQQGPRSLFHPPASSLPLLPCARLNLKSSVIWQSLFLCSLIDLLEVAAKPHFSHMLSESSRSLRYFEFLWKIPCFSLMCSKKGGFHTVVQPHWSHLNSSLSCIALLWVFKLGSQLHL